MIICCGYNSFENQNHIKIIAELVSLPEEVKKKLLFVFPMTYGNDAYRERVAKRLSKTNLEYKIFNEFMTDDMMARVRLVSAVMIHLPDTDQLSGSMQEHIYAGSTIITGNWGPCASR